jgi:hypothetical protein
MSEAAALGGAQKTVTLGALAQFKIPLPPIDQQEKIVGKIAMRLNALERAERALAAAVAATASMNRAFLDQNFTTR